MMVAHRSRWRVVAIDVTPGYRVSMEVWLLCVLRNSVLFGSATPWTVDCVHGIFQARILEWVVIPFSRVSS